jgi:undecaprenyl-diphosphatase
LTLAPWLFNWKDPGLSFDIALHLGTLAAVLLYFFRDWLQIIAQAFGISFGDDLELRKHRNLLWLLVIATIPAGVFGLLFNKQAEEEWRSPYLIAFTMISVGLLMWWADRASRGRKRIEDVSLTDAGLIGTSQALAIVPGVSRAGITMSTGLFRDLDRETAARFSFLLSTPTIAGAALHALYKMSKTGGPPADQRTAFALGIVISGIVGCLVIRFFLKYMRQHGLQVFVAYRVIFGIIVIALALFRHSAG